MYTLVVVDMQFDFASSRKPSVIKNCLALVKQAVKDKAGIVFLEYDTYGKTHLPLRLATSKYKKKFELTKQDDDGSPQVLTAIKKGRLPKQQIKVCGVNTTYCVAATVGGLTKRLPNAKIEVIGKACNSTSPTNHRMGLKYMRDKLPTVKVK